MYNFFITIMIATIFGYLFSKFKVPGGMMVGSIVSIAILNIITGSAYMPSSARVLSQVIAGAFIGASIEKSDLIRLKLIFKPAATLIGSMMVLNILVGFIIYKFSYLDLMTSLMSAVPGGISNIPIISAEMGADASKVAVLQFIRLIVGIGVFPSMIAKITKMKSQDESAITSEDSKEVYKREKTESNDNKTFIITISLAIIFGVIGDYSGIAAGSIVLPMITIIALKLKKGRAYIPKWVKKLAQVLAGAYIGSGLQYSDVLEMRHLILPAIILISGYLFACVMIGNLLNKKFNMSMKEAMLTATPAGASDMALIASDIGIESADVVVLQIIRMVMAVSVFPQVVNFIVKMVG